MGFLKAKTPATVLPPIPPVPPPPPIKATSDDLKDEVKDKLRRRTGTAGTILTSGTGLTDEPETIKTASLLGSVTPPS